MSDRLLSTARGRRRPPVDARAARDYRMAVARRSLGRALLYAVLTAAGAVFFLPLFWLASSSLKIEAQVHAFPPQFIPDPIVFYNFSDALAEFPFWRSFLNTMVITAGVMVGNLFTCSLTAYAFARLRFPGRNALFVIVLGTMMIPYHVYLIPQYILFRDLGWLNTNKPLIVPFLFGQEAFFIFLLRQFFMSIPRDYDEAARIDGAGFFGTYWRVILPLSMPALGAVAIFTFMGRWNDFIGPLIYLNEPEKQTLAVAIRLWEITSRMTGVASYGRARQNQILAMATLLTIPPMLVFFFAQRYFIQGIVVTGIKG